MTRWYTLVAVLAVWPALVPAVQAQPGYPAPVGASRTAEPLRYTPEPQPYMVPGPINPLMAPPGPPDSLNLPMDHTSAFQNETFPPEERAYFHAGGISLQRKQLSNRTVLYRELFGTGIDTLDNDTLALILARQQFPAQFFRPLFNLHDMDMNFNTGYSGTLGYLYCDQAFELSGFYIGPQSTSQLFTDRGRLRMPFYPANVFPNGFVGNNGLWGQGDLAYIQYTNSLANAELNYRSWNSGIHNVELLVGLRYLNAQERVDLYMDDEFFVRNIFNENDLRRAANYSASTRNNIVAAQFGAEYTIPNLIESFSWLTITTGAKAAYGVNFIERTLRMTRGDGLLGFENRTNRIRFSAIYELTAALDVHILERVRLKAGYMALWALNVSEATSQIDFNLATQGSKGTDSGNMFWHGPMVELQLLF